ncbi:MAG: serine O-acetyltransferase [Clostridiales bacterium]|nr:serine O-acetyltransferase [Clostridiales bacterium]
MNKKEYTPTDRLLLACAAAYEELKEDIAAIKERDPAATSSLEVLLLYSGLHAIMAHRISHALYKRGMHFPARFISQAARFLTGVEIHPGATIGRGLFIDHGSGVVIGETTEIGDNCTLYQGVTLGGTGKDVGKRHPTLGNNVMVGSGAKILGPFRIGDNSKIAANAVVLEEIPPDSTAVGIPARVVRRHNQKVLNEELDHVHIPDPVSQELCRLRVQIERLERQVSELEKAGKTDKNDTDEE